MVNHGFDPVQNWWSFSSAPTTKGFPSSRCASAIQFARWNKSLRRRSISNGLAEIVGDNLRSQSVVPRAGAEIRLPPGCRKSHSGDVNDARTAFDGPAFRIHIGLKGEFAGRDKGIATKQKQ
jgi:hypothetical protein